MTKAKCTDLLDKTIEQRRKVQEELRLQLIEKVCKVLDKLAMEIPFEEAYLFGSILKPGKFIKDSDIDIGFIGLKDIDFFRAMSFISSELGVDVDIVQLEGHRLADKVKKEGLKWTQQD